jgi:hypothetical protein
LQLPTERNRKTPSYRVVKLMNCLVFDEHFSARNHFLPIVFQAEIFDCLSETKGKLNCCAVAANIFRSIELSGTRCVRSNSGPASPIANVIIPELKETEISRRAVGGRRCERERVQGQTIIVQESFIHALVQFIFLEEKLRLENDTMV